jgi:hypothetical protein
MRSKQRGVTFIGWLLLLTPLAICGYACLRVTPIYLNYMQVARTLEQVKSEWKGGGGGGDTAASVRLAIEKHLNVDGVEFPDVKDFKITRDGKSWVVNIAYDDQAPLFANVSILASFDKTVTIGSEGGD